MAETRAMATTKAQAKVQAKASTKGKYAWLAQVEHVEGLAEALPSKPTKELKLVEAQTGPLMYEGRPCSGLNVYQVEDVRVKDQLHRNDAGCRGHLSGKKVTASELGAILLSHETMCGPKKSVALGSGFQPRRKEDKVAAPQTSDSGKGKCKGTGASSSKD